MEVLVANKKSQTQCEREGVVGDALLYASDQASKVKTVSIYEKSTWTVEYFFARMEIMRCVCITARTHMPTCTGVIKYCRSH